MLAADVKKYVSAVGVYPRMVGIAYPALHPRQGRPRPLAVLRRGLQRAEYLLEHHDPARRQGRNGGRHAVATDHLDIRTYPSESSVAAGTRFSIVVDVTPKPRIHVYAPGAASYQVIGVTISPQPFVRVLPVTYPPSQTYTFKPLNERVQVYEKPFTLVREIVLEGSPDAMRRCVARRASR